MRYSIVGFVAAALVVGLGATARPAQAQNAAQGATLRLPRIFADGMVLQRDVPVPVWGWAAPGAAVVVALDGKPARATADAAGAWKVSFPALKAGGPHELAVESGGARIQVRDILAGDVWVASGQSNMEFPVSRADNAAEAIAAAHDPELRSFTVPQSYAERPQSDLVGGSWAPADPQHVGSFSAVGYFFSRNLRSAVGVPIGLIHTSWGGSNIETWLSAATLGLSDSAAAEIRRREEAATQAVLDTLRAHIGTLPTADAGLVGGRALWADPELDESAWKELPVPGLWEGAGYPGLDGVAWYRTSFTLTDAEAKQGVRLGLAMIDDNDITWVNGSQVGRTNGYNIPRSYTVPATALRAGRNVLAVRVEDGGGGGGIYGPADQVYLEVGGQRRPLPATWKFRVGEVTVGRMDGQRINKIPTWLYNRMIFPLLPYPVKGVIWYQGESNANSDAQAAAYRDLFQRLITGWRREWTGGGAMPFLWVQLPNFGQVDSVPPARATWATLRESQTAALALPHTGQAVAIDIGDPLDIHPRNKLEVGRRLALVGRSVAYGQKVEDSGPTFRRMTVAGGRAALEFDHAAGGLAARDPANVTGFAIAGADQRFVWANARIEGNRVVVWSDAVPQPVAVRYAWSNSPRAPALYGQDGLPAAPFRTDTWP